MLRRLQPELLDTLPPDSEEARRSRRDLARVNRVMGNPAWFVRTVVPLARGKEVALEVGAGDGELARKLSEAGLETEGLDRFPALEGWRVGGGWHVGDLRTFEGWEDYPVVVGNLILHHLDDAELRELGARFDRHARVLVFNEPLRHWRARWMWKIGAPLGGAGAVTRHDGRVSIEAGFWQEELPQLLGLGLGRWSWRVTTGLLGAYRFVAYRLK